MMKTITHFFVLSCYKASLLIEKGNVLPLSFTQRIQLKLHTKICDKCNNYQKQSKWIDLILKKQLDLDQKKLKYTLSDEIKCKINSEIEKKLKK